MNDKISYEKGSWQAALSKSADLLDRSAKNRKQASSLLWEGAKTGIGVWLPTSATDVSAEALHTEVLGILGKSRKGDASKIRTVAVAVRNNGLDVTAYDNLSKAYAEARRLTVQVRQDAEDDDAAEKALEAIEVPKTTTTVDGAAALLLSKGIDGAVVAILDTLGSDNTAAHRSFLRAVSTEINSRVQAAAKAESDAKRDEAAKKRAEREAEAKAKAEEKAKKIADAKEAKAKEAKAKAKTAKKAAAAKKATPKRAEVSETKTKTKATPVKKAAVKKAVVKRPAR